MGVPAGAAIGMKPLRCRLHANASRAGGVFFRRASLYSPAESADPRGGRVGVDPSKTTLTRWLGELEAGNDVVLDRVFAVLYQELREVARRQRRRWRDDHTLDTTALLHEAYLKLADQSEIAVESRAHFLALASRAMRHILCNYARDRRALKRGGGWARVTLDERVPSILPAGASDEAHDALVSLDTALKRLEQIDPRQTRIIECRFFGGLTVEETAEAIGVSPRTVKRDWSMAQAWLHREMTAEA
jgi:RNA polymerase sigma factor (TIGR02999 family)